MPTAIAVISTRPPVMYDAEYHIGLVPWENTALVREANTEILNSALDNMHYNGNFEFAHGEPGPVLYSINCPGKTYYFKPPIKTGTKIGGSIFGTGGSTYIMLDGQFTWGPGLGGMKTRFIGINDNGDEEPLLRVRCNGFEINGIDLYGGQLIDWDSDPQKAIACIQVEGRISNVCGQVKIVNCGIFESTYGIQTIPGYYDDNNVFQSDENHSDNSIVDGCVFANVNSCFRSENLQGLNWDFRNIIIGGAGNHQPKKTIVFDMETSGFILANRVIINYAPIVLIRVNSYSPHVCNMEVSGVYTDRDSTPKRSDYWTLFSYEGTGYYEVPGTNPWRVRIQGGFGDYNFSRWDTSRLIYSNPNSPLALDLSDIYVDMLNLPTDCLTLAGEGPFYKVNETIANYQSEIRAMSSYYRLDETSGTSVTDEEDGEVTASLSGTTHWTNNTSTYSEKFKTRTITGGSWSSNVVTFTSNSHGFEDGQIVTVSSVSPSGYNGIFTITSHNTNTFSAALTSNPGGYSSGGNVRHSADGGGLYLASTSAYLNIPYATENLLYINSTIAFWIYLNSWTNGVVLSRTDAATANSKNGFRVEASGKFYLTESIYNHVDFASGVGNNLFTTKKWFHIAVSLNGSNVYKAYINGNVATAAGGTPGTMTGGQWLSMNWPESTPDLPLRVGAPTQSFSGSGTNAADMVIDDIRMYKRVLSDGAVTALYNIGSSL